MEESKYLEILQRYVDEFGELPVLPLMGNYGTIINEMEEALIAKKPLTPEEVMELFEDEEIDVVDSN